MKIPITRLDQARLKALMGVLRWFSLITLLLLLVTACGGGSSQPPQERGPGDGLDELIAGAVNGQVDEEVTVKVSSTVEAQTLTTLVVPAADTPLILEATGTTSSGKDFKLTFYGPSADAELLDFSGKMRLQGQLSQIQSRPTLRGTATLVQTAGGQASTAYPFIATNLNTTFTGPAEGTVFELRGNSALRAVCGDDELAGLFNFTGNAQVKGVTVGLFDDRAPCQQNSKLNPTLQSHLNVTAVQTHMGILLSGPGNMGGNVSGAQTVFSVFALIIKEELPESIGFVDIEPAAGARVIDAEAAKEFISFDLKTGTLVVSDLKGSLSKLEKGDVIVSTPRPAAPNGLLRRVESIDAQPGKVTIKTSRATLKDAIESANMHLARNFTSADRLQAVAWEQGRLYYPQVEGGLATQGLFDPIDLTINKVLYDQDDNTSTTDDQIKVSGNVHIEPRVVIDLDCSGFLCTKPDFLAKFEMEESSELTLTGDLTWQDDESIQLVRIPLPPITAFILVFTPEIVVTLNASGEINVSVEYHVEQEIDFEVGVEYESGKGWDTIDTFNQSFSHTPPSFAADIEAEAGLEVEGRLMLYGVAGVSAGIELYAEFIAGIPRDPSWELTGGLRGTVGVDLDVIVWQEEFDIEIFDESWSIAEAPNTPPEITRLVATTTCPDGTVPRGVLSGLVGLDANTDDAEDGKGQGTVSWHSDIDGDLGTTSAGSRHNLDADLVTNGPHTITATATDEDGATDTDTVQIEVVSACVNSAPPFVDITTQSNVFNTIKEGEALTLEATTRGGIGGDTCCEITWESDVEGFLGMTTGGININNDRVHSFEHTFSQIVGQTITASVELNGATMTDSIDLVAITQQQNPPNLSTIQTVTNNGSSQVYESDRVEFNVSSSANLSWASSDPNDVLSGEGTSVSASFATPGPRTITVTARDDEGGFDSQAVTVRVSSSLAKP